MLKTIILIFVLLLALKINAATTEQHTKVILRSIAHEFLLQLNDSTSRILPIENINGRFAIRFESELSFEPDMLSFSTLKVLEKASITTDYIVEIERCNSTETIHSFQTTPDKNLTPCKQRALPKGCYIFYFSTITPLESEKTNQNQLFYITTTLLIALISLLLFLFFTKKKNKNVSFITIGAYQLDPKRMLLIYKNQSTELSSKETDLLIYFHTNNSQTLKREQILNTIWDDNGQYIGRTLDVYVSKLRKKLQQDPNIKIINIRGVGYKFITNT